VKLEVLDSRFRGNGAEGAAMTQKDGQGKQARKPSAMGSRVKPEDDDRVPEDDEKKGGLFPQTTRRKISTWASP